MVVQTESEAPLEAEIERMESKKYIVVKNHVREIKHQHTIRNTSECVKESREKSVKNKKRKLHSEHNLSSENVSNTESISTSDLEELKAVYKKCKTVLRKIESKYTHLLDLNEENESSSSSQRNQTMNGACQHECKCTLNKKTIFSDDGEPISGPECSSETNMCPKKLKNYEKHYETQVVQVEYENLYNNLPESIKELTEILKDPSINVNLRNKVIEKIKYLRCENLNIIKFDKQSIIQKIKSNPDEMIDFKGSNISSLQGYPSDKIKS